MIKYNASEIMQLFMQTIVHRLDHATRHTNKPRGYMIHHATVYVWDGACFTDLIVWSCKSAQLIKPLILIAFMSIRALTNVNEQNNWSVCAFCIYTYWTRSSTMTFWLNVHGYCLFNVRLSYSLLIMLMKTHIVLKNVGKYA